MTLNPEKHQEMQKKNNPKTKRFYLLIKTPFCPFVGLKLKLDIVKLVFVTLNFQASKQKCEIFSGL